MITERTLKRWRKEALIEDIDYVKIDNQLILIHYKEMQKRILRMTQELLDLHLIRK